MTAPEVTILAAGAAAQFPGRRGRSLASVPWPATDAMPSGPGAAHPEDRRPRTSRWRRPLPCWAPEYAHKLAVVGPVLLAPLAFVTRAYAGRQGSQTGLSAKERLGVAYAAGTEETGASIREIATSARRSGSEHPAARPIRRASSAAD